MNTEILLIDDDETDFILTQEMLRTTPSDTTYKVDWAKNTREALQKMKTQKYDTYLVDYRLGSENGLDIIKQSLKTGYDGPFLLLTNTDDPELHKQSAESGVYDYLLKKELTGSLLNRTITHAIKRKAAEDALKKERVFTSNILTELPFMVIGVNKDGNIMSINPAATNISGYKQKELIGKHWKFIAPKDKGTEFNYNITNDGQVEFTSSFKNKQGKTRIVQWNILDKNINPRHGEDLGFILLGKNITEDIELENQARQKEKMEALGHLAGGVAHEINNLLQPILLSTGFMRDELKDNPKQLESLERISRNAQAAGEIVNDVLIFSRKDHEKDDKDLRLDAVILKTITLVEDMLPKDVQIKLDGFDEKSKNTAFVNETGMLRTLSNLILNAAHAMNDKGTVEISKKTCQINKGDKPLELTPGRYAKIDIQDKGKGIPQELLENIFTPFFTTKDVGQGTGLGLSIVHNTLSNWGGTITVESREGKGSTFSLYIPIK